MPLGALGHPARSITVPLGTLGHPARSIPVLLGTLGHPARSIPVHMCPSQNLNQAESRRYQRRAYDGKAAKRAADGHRRGRAESRRHQRRAYDGKAAKGSEHRHRRGTAESRRYQRRALRWEGSEGIRRRPSMEGPREGIIDGAVCHQREEGRFISAEPSAGR